MLHKVAGSLTHDSPHGLSEDGLLARNRLAFARARAASSILSGSSSAIGGYHGHVYRFKCKISSRSYTKASKFAAMNDRACAGCTNFQ